MTIKELNELLGWTQEAANGLKDTKKMEPNHRRNRAASKRARASRKRNR